MKLDLKLSTIDITPSKRKYSLQHTTYLRRLMWKAHSYSCKVGKRGERLIYARTASRKLLEKTGISEWGESYPRKISTRVELSTLCKSRERAVFNARYLYSFCRSNNLSTSHHLFDTTYYHEVLRSCFCLCFCNWSVGTRRWSWWVLIVDDHLHLFDRTWRSCLSPSLLSAIYQFFFVS